MLRLCAIAGRHGPLPCRCLPKHARPDSRLFRTTPSNSSSGSSGGSGVGSALAGTLLFTLGVGGGVVGYAAFDDKFRKQLEDGVPYSKEAFDAVLGPLDPLPPPPKPKPSVPPPKLKLSNPVMITKPKEEEKKPKVVEEKKVEIEKPEVKPPPVVEAPLPPPPPVISALPPPPPLEEPVKIEVPPPVIEPVPEPPMAVPEPVIEPIPEPPKAVPEPVIEPIPEPVIVAPPVEEIAPVEEKPSVIEEAAKEEAVAPVEEEKPASPVLFSNDVENESLEQVLKELQDEMRALTENAVKSLDKGADAVVSHIGIMQTVLESNLAARDDNSWNQVFEAATAKSDALKEAERKEKEAMIAISNVVKSIEAGRRNKTTATNPELLVAEEEVNAAMYRLEQGRARIGTVEGEARVMEQYRDIVEEGRQQFNKEMAAIMPDVKLGESSKRLTEDELNMFITHAYRKVLYLQQELAKQQTLEQQRFKQALEKLKIEAQMAASEKMDNELERQKREMEIEHQKRLAAIKEDAETELRIQLRRQAAAHTDHITDVLTVQEAELTRKHEHAMDETLSKAESDYLAKLAGLNGAVEGLASALEDRAQADKNAVSAQKLWLACLALRNSIDLGNLSATNLDTTMKPLANEIGAIKELAGDCEMVQAIISGIPATAVERGVYTETALRDRFNKVQTVASRVSRIGNEGGSLLKYGLSYLESMLLIDTVARTPTGSDEPIDVSSLDCPVILSEARHSLERGDIVRAVQYLGLLEGEPRRVASDWIAEARLHLEAKQASQALLAHAAVVSLEVLP